MTSEFGVEEGIGGDARASIGGAELGAELGTEAGAEGVGGEGAATVRAQERGAQELSAAARPPVRYDQSWLTSLLRPLLIVLLVASLAVVLGVVMARLGTGLPDGFAAGIVVLAVIAAIIGVTTTTVLAQPSQRANRRPAARLAEIGLILAVVRLYVWIAGSGIPSLEELLEAPLSTLLDMLFLVCAAIVGISWFIASEITDDFAHLALSADEIRMFERHSDRGGDSMRGSAIDRRTVLNGFTMRWATFGLVLILLSVLVRRNFSVENFYGLWRQDVEPVVMFSIILYFVAGLLLISHGQLALLRARWTLDQTPSDGSVTRRWPLLVGALLLTTALTAAFLPLGGTFYLAVALSALIGGALALVMLAQRFALFGLFWLLNLFAPDSAPPPAIEAPPPASIVQQLPQTAPTMPTWIGGALFWVAIVALVGYAAWVYLHDRGAHLRWLAWLWAALRRRAGEARTLVRRRKKAGAPTSATDAPGSRWSLLDWWRRGPQGPDDEVRYLYLAALKEASDVGVGRSPSETPLHFAPRLEAAVAAELDATRATQELTDAFVEVRYARRSMTRERVAALRARWEALRRALHARE